MAKISCWQRGPLIAPLSSRLMPRPTLSWARALYRGLFVCQTYVVSDNIVFAHVGAVLS
jgi:hypothetical protein